MLRLGQGPASHYIVEHVEPRSVDPSPFRERDLDPNAAEFIVSWAGEARRDAPLALVVHLDLPNGLPEDYLPESGTHWSGPRLSSRTGDRRGSFRRWFAWWKQ